LEKRHDPAVPDVQQLDPPVAEGAQFIGPFGVCGQE
jgi:hypothetical protein